ncbi:hypothetical protein [Actinomycetospora sp. CA-053990]|uniref:hypothetical protein n=1 Tax=Actinomycetospora sp. CA-053990 TaxID=3239891 RepID=UPI003D94F610
MAAGQGVALGGVGADEAGLEELGHHLGAGHEGHDRQGPVAPPAGEREAGEDDHRQRHRGDTDELEHPEALPTQAQVGGHVQDGIVEGPAGRVEHGGDVGADHRGDPEHHGGDRGHDSPAPASPWRRVEERHRRDGREGGHGRHGPCGGCGPADRRLCGA